MAGTIENLRIIHGNKTPAVEDAIFFSPLQ